MGNKAKKSLGQNFLVDQLVIDEIVAIIDPKKDQCLLEIGPGKGALTCAVLRLVDQLDAVEFDTELLPDLNKRCANLGCLKIYNQDALLFDYAQWLPCDTKGRLFGNLPYNIATPLIFHILGVASRISDMTFMVQQEVADRIVARPGTKAYGRLSVMVQYRCQVEKVLTVLPESFSPKPKVYSSIVKFFPYTVLPHVARNYELFADLVKQAFSMRRKILRNVLNGVVTLDQFEQAHINPLLRAEALSVADFVRLANVLAGS